MTLNIKKEFGIDKFDIIIGNPPYNKDFKGKNGYASPIIHDFIEKYIDYLSFIVPSRWFLSRRPPFISTLLLKEILKSNVDIKGGLLEWVLQGRPQTQLEPNQRPRCDLLGRLVRFLPRKRSPFGVHGFAVCLFASQNWLPSRTLHV